MHNSAIPAKAGIQKNTSINPINYSPPNPCEELRVYAATFPTSARDALRTTR